MLFRCHGNLEEAFKKIFRLTLFLLIDGCGLVQAAEPCGSRAGHQRARRGRAGPGRCTARQGSARHGPGVRAAGQGVGGKADSVSALPFQDQITSSEVTSHAGRAGPHTLPFQRPHSTGGDCGAAGRELQV